MTTSNYTPTKDKCYLRLIYKNGYTELHEFNDMETAEGFADGAANTNELCEAWIIKDCCFLGNCFYEDLYAAWYSDYTTEDN